MSDLDFLSREQVMGGLPAKRARTLLFLLESRAGLLAAQSRRALDKFSGAAEAQVEELAFVEAFTAGKEPPRPPTIQELERFAPQWVDLVPDNPRLRAALAKLLGEKYAFTKAAAPRLRAALGLDSAEVGVAFQALHDKPLASIYAPTAGPLIRLRWLAARFETWFEGLSPFWTSFSLTLTETVGAAILALPIALAKVGPLAGLALVVLLGLVNVATIGYMAEAVARSGLIRRGEGFLGQILSDYLGPAASAVLSLGLGAMCFMVLQAYYIGFSATLSEAAGLPQWLWTAALYALGMWYVTRPTMTSTVASAMLVAGVNLAIIVAVSVLALGHLDAQLFFYHPPLDQGFDASWIELAFGVVLGAYCGHLSIANCARTVLKRDPAGRSLIRGAMASMLVTVALYGLWVVAVNSAVAPGRFEGLPGTSFTPLAERFGPAISVLGTIFVILGMGMASIHFSLGLANLIGERLPRRVSLALVLARGRGRLKLAGRTRPDRAPRLSLAYLGRAGGAPRLALTAEWQGRVRRMEVGLGGPWRFDPAGLEPAWPWPARLVLEAEPLEAASESLRLVLSTSLAARFEGQATDLGLDLGAVLDRPAEERRLLTWLLRRDGVGLAEAADFLHLRTDRTAELLAELIKEGLVLERPGPAGSTYRAVLAQRRVGRLPEKTWLALTDEAPPPAEASGPLRPGLGWAVRERVRGWLLGPTARTVARQSPTTAAFLLTLWLYLTGQGSFSGVLNLVGVLIVPLMAGIFPVLLIISSRRKGEVPAHRMTRLLDRPILLGLIFALFLASFFAYGLIIWTEPVPRALVTLVGLGVAALTWRLIRRGGFDRRIVLEVGRPGGPAGPLRVELTSGGEPWPMEAGPAAPSAGASPPPGQAEVNLTVPLQGAGEIKVLAAAGQAGVVAISSAAGQGKVDLSAAEAGVVVAVKGERAEVGVKA